MNIAKRYVNRLKTEFSGYNGKKFGKDLLAGITVAAVALPLALAFGVSRLCMSLMNDYVESMGVVLNMAKVYPMELIILLAVFIISIIPTSAMTLHMSRKDSIDR